MGKPLEVAVVVGTIPTVSYAATQKVPPDVDELALAGGQLVAVWSRLPLNAELPDLVYRDQIGSVRFRDLRGVALDDRYFYLADEPANVVYVWRGLPSAGAEPAFTLSVNGPSRLSSDGTYLAVTQTFDHAVRVFRVAELSANAAGSRVGGVGVFNLPQGATVAAGALFVANTSFNGLHVWRNAEDAMASRPAGAILGTNAGPGKAPQIGDATLFPRNEEVELSWSVIDPLEEFWSGTKPELYRAGEWGPKCADDMLARDGRVWRRP